MSAPLHPRSLNPRSRAGRLALGPAFAFLLLSLPLAGLSDRGRPVGPKAVPLYSITQFPQLGGIDSEVVDLDDMGRAIGNVRFTAGAIGSQGFSWDGTATADLPTLGGTYDTARAMNAAGDIVGDSLLDTPPNKIVACIWKQGVPTDLKPFDGKNIESTAYAINTGGTVVGYTRFGGDDHFPHAFSLKDGVTTDLGTLPGLNGAIARDINDTDDIVGVSGDSNAARAFLYSNGTMTMLSGSGPSIAIAINASRQIVGNYSLPDGKLQGAIWEGETRTDLGSLGGSTTQAYDINDAGFVVGSSEAKDGELHAFIWKNGEMTDLNSVVPAGSGLVLAEAFGINNRNEICGYALDNNAVQHAFVLSYADLKVTLTASPGPVTVPAVITYQVQVRNLGPSLAKSATITDVLPAALEYVSAGSTAGWTLNGSTLTFDCGNIKVGEGREVLLKLRTAADGEIANTVSASSLSGDAVPENSSSSVTRTVLPTKDVDVSVTIAADATTIEAGKPVTYTVGINNAGPGAATQVTVSDPLPAGATFVPGTSTPGLTVESGKVVYRTASLAKGAVESVQITLVPSKIGTLKNTVTATTTANDTVSGNNSASTNVTVTAKPPSLKMFGLNLGAVKGGKPVIGTVTLTGPAIAGGAQITFTSSNTKVLPTPRPLTIPAGKSSGKITIPTRPTRKDATVTLKATYGTLTASVALKVTKK